MGTAAPENTIVDSSLAIKLGRQLFFDRRLSLDNTVACASCHHPRKAFTDGRKNAAGIKGRKTMRNTPTLLNVKNQPHFMLDAGVHTLEMQALVPLRDTAEMGSNIKELIHKLRGIDEYVSLAANAYNRALDPFVLTSSLALFQKQLVSNASNFDRWFAGDNTAISEKAEKGFYLFSGKMNCIACHALPNFTNHQLKNNGWHKTYADLGHFRISRDSSDIGKFKVPTLRNIMLTAPYMHDGSADSIAKILENYQNGGSGHYNQSMEIEAFQLTSKERDYVIAFFNALTDTSYLSSLTKEERTFE